MPRAAFLTLAAALLLAGCGGANAPTSGPVDCVPPVVGHRGEPAVAPEETIASFTAAIDDGAKTIEGDVHFTKDGQPVMLHDDTVDRTTDGTGRVSAKTLAQVESLDAGGWMGNEWKGVRVPTLEAFLHLAKSQDVHVIVELKQPRATKAQVRTFLSDISKAGMAARTLVESFHAGNLKTVRALNPAMETALVTTTPVSPKKAKSLGDALLPKLSIATPSRVQAWQDAGLKVYPWTADTEAEWAQAAKAKVDGILTNRTTDYQAWAREQCQQG
jgi:glycerophosphoryl diester phosphodiesterase